MKKIAVVLCGMEYSNQQELVQGMIQYQSEHGGSIHVFHCSGDHLQTGGYKRGAFKIFDLLNPQNYDGIILARETLHEKKYAKTRGGTFEGEWRSGDFRRGKNRGHGLHRI